MKKYFVLFCIPAATMQDWMKNTDEKTRKEQSNKMMKEWQTWMNDNAKSIVDKGLPVGKTTRITAGGPSDARNDINFYIVMQGESREAVAALLKNHPHFQIPDAYIDVSDASGMGM